MFYLLVNPFLCTRSKFTLKFAMGEKERLDGMTNLCPELSGQACQGCINRRSSQIMLQGSMWDFQSVQAHVQTVKHKICSDVEANGNGGGVTWRNRVTDTGAPSGFFNAWAILELFVVDGTLWLVPVFKPSARRISQLQLATNTPCIERMH